jgi:hypothetical protein
MGARADGTGMPLVCGLLVDNVNATPGQIRVSMVLDRARGGITSGINEIEGTRGSSLKKTLQSR